MVLIVALIVLNFAGIFCFGSSLLIDCKIEVGIFMIDWLKTSLFCECLFAKEERNMKCFCDGRIVCVAEGA